MTRSVKNFVLKISRIGGGTAAGQLLMLISLPFLTRLYSPEDFGSLGVFVSWVGILLPVMAFRFDVAVSFQSSDRASFIMLCTALFAAALSAAIIFVVLLAMIPSRAQQPELLLWFPLVMLAASCVASLRWYMLRLKYLNLVSISQVIRGISGASVQVALGVAGLGSLGLVIGQVAYLVAEFLLYARPAVRSFDRERSSVSQRKIFSMARKNWRYPVFSVPESLLDSAGANLPTILIAGFWGAEAAGVFYLARRIVMAPVSLVSLSVARIYMSEASHLQSEGVLGRVTERIMLGLLVLGVLGSGFVFVVLEIGWATSLLGSNWQRATEVIPLLLPVATLQLCVSPVSNILHLKSLQFVALKLQSVGLLLQVAPVAMAAILEIDDPVQYYSAGAVMYYLVYIVTVRRVTKRP